MAGKKGRSGPPGNLNSVKNGRATWLRRRMLPAHLGHVVAIVSDEEQALIQHLGGDENATEPERALLRDAGKALGLILLAFEEARSRGCIVVGVNGTWDLAPGLQRVKGLIDTRRQSLLALGLARRAKPVPNLADYIAQKYGQQSEGDGDGAQAQPDGASSGDPAPEATSVAAEQDPGIGT